MLYRINDSLALKQASIFVAGAVLLALTILLLRDYRVLQRYRYLIATAGILLLHGPTAAGRRVAGQRRLPGNQRSARCRSSPRRSRRSASSSSSPATWRENRELLTVAARRIAGVTIPPIKHFGPVLVVWGATMIMLVFIRDLGSSLMFFGAFLALLYVATSRLSYVIAGLTLFFVGATLIASQIAHVQDRVDIWLRPVRAATAVGAGQIQQSLFAQADGGLFGQGLGESLLKLPGRSRRTASSPSRTAAASCRRRTPTRSTR